MVNSVVLTRRENLIKDDRDKMLMLEEEKQER